MERLAVAASVRGPSTNTTPHDAASLQLTSNQELQGVADTTGRDIPK